MSIIKASAYKCEYQDCGHVWIARPGIPEPRQCAKCRRTGWNNLAKVIERHEKAIKSLRSKKPMAVSGGKIRVPVQVASKSIQKRIKAMSGGKAEAVSNSEIVESGATRLKFPVSFHDPDVSMKDGHDPKTCRMKPCFRCEAIGVKK